MQTLIKRARHIISCLAAYKYAGLFLHCRTLWHRQSACDIILSDVLKDNNRTEPLL